MAERRKRNSLWDKEAETKHFSGMSENSYRTGKEHHSSHDSGQYREFSSSGSYRSPNFRYHSGQPSLETIEDDPVSPMNGSFTKSRERVHEGREMGGESRYYQKMSPDFRSNQSLGNDRSHSYRYPGRGRSRSPSRSLSRGRERERARGRSRSRSRSRSRGDDMAESWRNRTAHGHTSRHSYSSRNSRSELRDDVSDPYYGEDDQFQNKSRSAIPCKDFIKGNCRWGDACRFSHHFASDEQQPYKNGKPLCKYFAAGRCDRDNCRFSHEDPRFNSLEGRQGKVTDEGSLGNENRNWKIPERKHNLIDRDNRSARNVTYGGDLAVGESHDDSRFNSLEGRQGKVTDEGSLGNENRNWKIPERTHNLIDRDNRAARNVTYGGDLAAGESHEDSRFNSLEGRQGKVTDKGSLGNENRNWKIPGRTHNLIDRGNRPARNVTYGGELAAVESIVMENIDKKQELLTQFQNQDVDFKVQGPNRLVVDQQMPWEPWSDLSQVSHIQQPSPVSHIQQPSPVSHIQQPSPVSHIQQPSPVSHIQQPSPVSQIQQPSPVSQIQQLSHLVVENNPVSSFRSDVLVELKDPRKATVPIVLTGENLTQNGEDVFPGHSLIPSETHIGLNIPYPNPSHLAADLNLQSQMQSHEKAIQTTEVLATRILDFFPKIVTTESTPQFINPITFPTQGPENEHSRKDVDAQVPNPMGMPLFETTNMQAYQAKVSDVPINPIQNERGTNEQGEPTEEDNKMQIERSSPLPVAGGELENSGVVHSGKLKQEPVVANAEVDEGKIVTGEENKGDKNDKRTETLDGHGKNEESNANKEDKGTRLFKNALIEFVKDILKPTWKEGKMSRDVHKTIVKKVVDKVSSTIQVDHIPKTQEKVDQYLSYSQPKIAKLVQAYVGRAQKTDS